MPSPRSRAQDEAFFRMREVLFEDHDFLMLVNPALDGVELPPSRVPSPGYAFPQPLTRVTIVI